MIWFKIFIFDLIKYCIFERHCINLFISCKKWRPFASRGIIPYSTLLEILCVIWEIATEYFCSRLMLKSEQWTILHSPIPNNQLSVITCGKLQHHVKGRCKADRLQQLKGNQIRNLMEMQLVSHTSSRTISFNERLSRP